MQKIIEKKLYCQTSEELESKDAVRKENVFSDDFFAQHVLPSEEAIECGWPFPLLIPKESAEKSLLKLGQKFNK